MEVKVKHIKCDMNTKDKELMNKFMKFLQKHYPLKNNITVIFTGERFGDMTTGSRTSNSELKILTKGRLNRDVSRTLAHEWVHEWQRLTKGKERGPDIGGENEDEANAKAGSIIKKFEKSNPKEKEMMYEGINNKIKLLNESILLTEKLNIRNNFLTEMKKIGIEKLPYSYSAMNQFVDPETMDIHYNKHYKGYVKKLNDALSNKKGEVELEDIIKNISKYDTKVRNNAGGAFNHALFWKMLSPKKQLPKGEILRRINSADSKWKNKLIEKVKGLSHLPHIIIMEIFSDNSDTKTDKVQNKATSFDLNGHKYVLDSAVIRDTSKQHFCATLTCEDKEMAYDGMSFHRLVNMEWKKHINSDYKWQFLGSNDANNKPLTWNFVNGYQLLVYYREQ